MEKHLARAHPQVLPTNEALRPSPASDIAALEVRREEPPAKPDEVLPEVNPPAARIPAPPPPKIHQRCPLCGHEILEEQMQTHLNRAHRVRPPVEQVIAVKDVPAAIPLIACPQCGAKVREDCMGLHFISCHPAADQARSVQVGAHRLPFVLLPPGTSDIRQVVEHYRKIARDLPRGHNLHQIDPTRLERIQSLKPIKCYIGKDSWLGYVVFEFSHSPCVVLECPIEGNATYVLFGDWKVMVSHTKAEIRHRFANFYTRIVHKGDWLSRLRATLRESRSSRP